MNIIDVFLILLLSAICARLLFYRRGRSAFKWIYSFIAYVLIVISGGLAIALLTGVIHSADIPQFIILIIKCIAIAIFYCAGNVARLIKLPGRIKHAFTIR